MAGDASYEPLETQEKEKHKIHAEEKTTPNRNTAAPRKTR